MAGVGTSLNDSAPAAETAKQTQGQTHRKLLLLGVGRGRCGGRRVERGRELGSEALDLLAYLLLEAYPNLNFHGLVERRRLRLLQLLNLLLGSLPLLLVFQPVLLHRFLLCQKHLPLLPVLLGLYALLLRSEPLLLGDDDFVELDRRVGSLHRDVLGRVVVLLLHGED